MTENNAAKPVLTDDEIQDIEASAEFSWCVPRAIEQAVLSKLRAEGVQAGDERKAFSKAFPAAFWREGEEFPDQMWAIDVLRGWNARAALASAPVADERAAQGYGSPADVAQRIEQYLYHDGRKNSATQLLYEAMKALRRPAPAAGDALDRDQQRLALWQAIRDITIGNLHDDKLILANLHKAGYVIALAAIAQQSQLKGDA
ncbi:hypothetical protein [Achromobacter marplatensis]